MKIWLDDIRPAPKDWTHARSVGQAIAMVQILLRDGGSFEAASLDHDMGDMFVHGGDGIAFVDWMAENDIWPVEKPYVHSWNPVGRERMLRSIERYWHEPLS